MGQGISIKHDITLQSGRCNYIVGLYGITQSERLYECSPCDV